MSLAVVKIFYQSALNLSQKKGRKKSLKRDHEHADKTRVGRQLSFGTDDRILKHIAGLMRMVEEKITAWPIGHSMYLSIIIGYS